MEQSDFFALNLSKIRKMISWHPTDFFRLKRWSLDINPSRGPYSGCFFLQRGTHRVQAQPLSLFDLLRVAQIRVFRLNIVGHLATIESWERERFTVRGIHKEDDFMTWDSG